MLNKKKAALSRLNIELLAAVAISLTASLLFFGALSLMANSFLYNYFDRTDYVKHKTMQTAEKFQQFVTKNNIATTDTKELSGWVNEQKIVTLYIVSGEAILFDSSQYPPQKGTESYTDEMEDDYDNHFTIAMLLKWFTPSTVIFRDRTATAYWQGSYDYIALTYCSYILMFLSFLLFVAMLTLLIRKKLHYISQLEYEIHILEGGNLEYEITVRGQDELSALAGSLNAMRLSFLTQIEAEKKARTANKELITALSHDLRTPLTTQMGYLEILKEKHWTTEKDRNAYMEKCLATCRQIKEMSDRLFEYFLAYSRDGEEKQAPLEEYDGLEIFSQLIAEKTILLEEKGFAFDLALPNLRVTVAIRPEYLCRIFDNVFSNIEKYADHTVPVAISVEPEENGCVLAFRNEIRTQPVEIDSTKIGLESVQSLMAMQNGSCEIRSEENVFTLSLRFPPAPGQGSSS